MAYPPCSAVRKSAGTPSSSCCRALGAHHAHPVWIDDWHLNGKPYGVACRVEQSAGRGNGGRCSPLPCWRKGGSVSLIQAIPDLGIMQHCASSCAGAGQLWGAGSVTAHGCASMHRRCSRPERLRCQSQAQGSWPAWPVQQACCHVKTGQLSCDDPLPGLLACPYCSCRNGVEAG